MLVRRARHAGICGGLDAPARGDAGGVARAATAAEQVEPLYMIGSGGQRVVVGFVAVVFAASFGCGGGGTTGTGGDAGGWDLHVERVVRGQHRRDVDDRAVL
jgi:hypothetical protein